MFIQPDQIDKLPKWVSVLFNAFNHWAPLRVHAAIEDFIEKVVRTYEIDERLPSTLREAFQAISCWWMRLTIGEREWAEFVRAIADDMRRPTVIAA